MSEFLAGPECFDFTAVGVHAGKTKIAIHIFGESYMAGCTPGNGVGRCFAVGSEVAGLASGDGNDVDISAGGTFVAHQALDEGHTLAIRRDSRIGKLQLWLVNLTHFAALRIDQIEPRHPPVRITVAVSGRCRPRLTIGRPVVLVDIYIHGRDLPEMVRAEIEGCYPLLEDLLVNDSRERGHRLQRARNARHAIDE